MYQYIIYLIVVSLLRVNCVYSLFLVASAQTIFENISSLRESTKSWLMTGFWKNPVMRSIVKSNRFLPHIQRTQAEIVG
jgi:hypothetical protein